MRRIGRVAGAIALTTVVWVAIRLVFPEFDYYPPEILTPIFERSWFVEAGLRKVAMLAYVVIELLMMAAFFAATQARWPGRRGAKGMAFGLAIGLVWAIGFLTGWAFMGTTLWAEALNGALDLPPLALGGWLVGRAIGRDVPRPEDPRLGAWPAIVFIAVGYLLVHVIAGTLLAPSFGAAAVLLIVPETPLQVAVLSALGALIGAIYVMMRPGLRSKTLGAGEALFAFGVVGHCWAWFQLFFVIEFEGVAPIVLSLAAMDATGVFIGAVAYEILLGARPSASSAQAR